jgi:tRNA (mo5U34)-methyltransferase
MSLKQAAIIKKSFRRATNGDALFSDVVQFRTRLEKLKTEIDPTFPWYPYNSLSNFAHLRRIFNAHPLETLADNQTRILDIGAADGDLSFFLETLGYQLDIIDYGPTNFNHLRGARLLKQALASSVTIHEMDIDSHFAPPGQRYDLTFFLGILYHLKNPFFLLEALSKISRYLLVSTKVARFAPDGTDISHLPLGYLLDNDECNNDSTNYWIFSTTGLQLLFRRSRWEVIEYFTVGDMEKSNPRDMDHDERAFALLRSTIFA